MRTPYKTQCPRCKTIYPMLPEKLDNPKARANCGKCHHIFFLNANLVKDDQPFAPKPVTTEVNTTAIQKVAVTTPATPSTSEATLAQSAPQSAQPIAQPTPQPNIGISQKSSQTIAKLVKEQPELNATHTAKQTNPFAAIDALIHNNLEAQANPETVSPTPTQTTMQVATQPVAQSVVQPTTQATPSAQNTVAHTAPQSSTIHNTSQTLAPQRHINPNANQAIPESSAYFDELDDFMKNDVVIPPPQGKASQATTDSSKESSKDDDAWFDDLLGNNKRPAGVVVDAINGKSAKSAKKDEMSDIFGEDFAKIPTISATATLDKKELQRRAEERLAAQSPSQEKLSKERGILGQFMWIIGSIGLLLALAVQYVIFNTDNIAKHPRQSQLLHSVCQLAACNLPKADPNAFSSVYELQVGKADHTTYLIGTLKNESGEDQLYPNLKISVYNHNGLAGDFVATPKDYLTTEQRLLPANQGRRYMFTLVDILPSEVSKVKIEPFY